MDRVESKTNHIYLLDSVCRSPLAAPSSSIHRVGFRSFLARCARLEIQISMRNSAAYGLFSVRDDKRNVHANTLLFLFVHHTQECLTKLLIVLALFCEIVPIHDL